MNSPNVQCFCEKLWVARDREALPSAMAISRTLALAVASDVMAAESYDPYEDRRVEWAREIVRQRVWLKPHLRPEADGPLEDTVAFLLGREFARVRSGKELAAGGAGE